MRKKRWKRSDFTLIEVVVVIIILVTLASIATPLYLNYVKKANVGAAKTQIKLLEEALTGFRLDVGSYPDSTVGLRALVENVDQNAKWNGPYLQAAVPKDSPAAKAKMPILRTGNKESRIRKKAAVPEDCRQVSVSVFRFRKRIAWMEEDIFSRGWNVPS